MNNPTVQDIFQHFYPAYLEKYSPSPEQAKAARNILNCKTGAYGANVSVCEDCGAVQIHYNSCRNRCCPMCQAVPKEMWMDARREDVLEAPYFHLVFTVPHILNPVIYSNQKQLYDILYHAASATINELAADPKHLGASVEYICILHTWGSEMNFHPHIHTILLGSGLTPKNEWKDNGTEFFLPIWVISRVDGCRNMTACLEREGYSCSTATIHKYMNTQMGLHSMVRRKKPGTKPGNF